MLNKRILTLIFVVAFVTLLVGCLPSQNETPIITSDPVKIGEVGVDYTYDVDATDPDEDVLTYSLVTKPTGMTINSATGLIKWTPTAKGVYSVVVKVSDGDLDITQSFTITVSEEEPGYTPITPPTQPPKLTSIVVVPDIITLSFGATLQLKVTAFYDDGNHGDVTSDCIYVSSNTKVVPLFDDGNLIAGQSPGEATITVTYTGSITKEATVEVTVIEPITIRWLEDSVRFYPDGSVWYIAHNDLIPPGELPATLILTNGEYHFADANEFYNYSGLDDFAGSVVIGGTGQLSGDTTYTSPASGLPIGEHIEGSVEIIIGGEIIGLGDLGDYDGIMVGTYTQWAYAFGTEEDVHDGYAWATLCEDSEDKWFIGYTIYIAHGGE